MGYCKKSSKLVQYFNQIIEWNTSTIKFRWISPKLGVLTSKLNKNQVIECNSATNPVFKWNTSTNQVYKYNTSINQVIKWNTSTNQINKYNTSTNQVIKWNTSTISFPGFSLKSRSTDKCNKWKASYWVRYFNKPSQ